MHVLSAAFIASTHVLSVAFIASFFVSSTTVAFATAFIASTAVWRSLPSGIFLRFLFIVFFLLGVLRNWNRDLFLLGAEGRHFLGRVV